MCESEVRSSCGSLPSETEHKFYSETEKELDRISNLPSEVIEDILSRLPIKEAVKTSVLSRKWMNISAMLRCITFDDQLGVPNRTTFTKIVDHLLLLHIGPMQTFKLSRQERIATDDIDRWIFHLSRNSIKELILDVWIGKPYKMPARLFFCDDLVHLELYNCVLNLPPKFKGFKSLRTLDLQKVTLAQDHVFENLIVSSPLLERLTFAQFNGFTNLKIDAPNLQFPGLEGVFQDISFRNTLYKLTDVSIGLDANVGKKPLLEPSSNLVKFFVHLPSIRNLAIPGYFLKYLAVGALPDKLPAPCMCLQFLSLTIRFTNSEETLAVICRLRSSPALQKLEISAMKENHPVLVEGANSSLDGNDKDCLLPQLQIVEITGISGGVKDELDLIRNLLSNSPVLKKMTVKPACANGFAELVKELLRFRRASAYAEIIYLDP